MDQYPLPRLNGLFTCLTGGTKFTKLDLSAAYQQLSLDAESWKLVTINTHEGLFQFTRLPFGVASALVVFQCTMDAVLQGIPQVICYIDNILVTGKTKAEHLSNLEEVLKRLWEHGVCLKKEKLFLQDLVEYLGHCIDEQGVHTSEKLKAIVEAPKPQNVQELRSFLGLFNYYAKFISNLSSILHPLNNLLRANQHWVWTHACNRAFLEAKSKLVSAHYDPHRPILMAGDASANGVGAVILLMMPDGTERPVAFPSRTLSPAEHNYAQGEIEALSLIFGIHRFHQYLYGRPFTLVTDHKPLTTILEPKKGIPALSAAWMQRWALLLSAYTYDIHFCPTQAHGNADGLSRLPVREDQSCTPDDVMVFNIAQLDALPVCSSELMAVTRTDPQLSKVLQYVRIAMRKFWTPCALFGGDEVS